MKNYADLLFVEKVRELQDRDGVGEKYAAFYPERTQEGFEDREINFIRERSSFYLASVSSTGWPYVQHRGGPKGFLKILGPNRLGFGDYRGNRQYVTTGHTVQDNRVAMILMDYENRARMKLLGRLTMTPVDEAEDSLVEELKMSDEGRVERIATIDVEAFDWNCPQFIPRLVEYERLEKLEAENEELREQLRLLKAK